MAPRQIYASVASRHDRRWSRQRRVFDPGWLSLSLVALAGAATWILGLLG